jgi:hypothetical protein
MIFKLQFHTASVTNLGATEIIDRIQFLLKDTKYNVDTVTLNSLSFSDNPWRLRWNFEAKMLDEGEFVVSTNAAGEKLLTLNYRYNLLWMLAIVAFLLISLASHREYWGILFFATFYGIAILIDILRAKYVARKLLANVLRNEPETSSP